MARTMLQWGKEFAGTVGLAVVLCASAAAGTPAERYAGSRSPAVPVYVWLWYADGTGWQPDGGSFCLDGRPPAFTCNYAATTTSAATTDPDACKRQVQEILDEWYADFNVVFTFSHPPTSDYYVLVITPNGAWCGQDTTIAGYTNFNNCMDNAGQVGYAFECAHSAHACATIIAHEHGHAVGLDHTASVNDVMYPIVQLSAAGFENAEMSTRSPDQDTGGSGFTCQDTQNSHQKMLTAMGAWPGGAKPGPFAAVPDGGARDASPGGPGADASHSSSSVGPVRGTPIDAAPMVALPGYDAFTQPPLPTVDAAGGRGSSGDGCSVVGRPSEAAALLMAGVLFAARLTRTRRAHRGQRADALPPCGGPARSPSAARAHAR